MKRKLLISCLSLFIAMSCQENIEEPQNPSAPKHEAVALDRDELALHVVDLLNERSVNASIISTLQKNKISTSISSILNDVKKQGFASNTTIELDAIVRHSEDALKGEELPDHIEIPELWMHMPEGNFDTKNIFVAYPPTEGDEKDWKYIKAYTLDKKVVYLDARKEPNVPVVVVETRGHEAFLLQVEYMNKILTKHGFQNSGVPSPSAKRNGIDTSILKKVSLRNDEEPWVKGSAEVYAITSGIRNAENEAQIKIIPMEYLDKEDKTYYPNQVLLFWDEYEYQAANILFYEQDSNYNYKELTSIIVQGVIDIAGSLSGQPWLTALGEITGAIIQAMPDDWYADTDDYVDALYTIEKPQSYYNYNGAAANIQVDIEPHFIPSN